MSNEDQENRPEDTGPARAKCATDGRGCRASQDTIEVLTALPLGGEMKPLILKRSPIPSERRADGIAVGQAPERLQPTPAQPQPPYSQEDLTRACEELARWQEKSANDSSNNPDKHRGAIKSARRMVEIITLDLKIRGLIPPTEQEKLEAELDRAFPKAKSKDVVELNGKRYQLRFMPAEKSRSRKTVMSWHRWWEELK